MLKLPTKMLLQDVNCCNAQNVCDFVAILFGFNQLHTNIHSSNYGFIR